MTTQQLNGLIPATFTPFHQDGSLDLDRIETLAGFAVRDGVTALFVCGTTGEGQSLTLDERKQVVERWQSVLAGQLPVIVHVGHTALPEAQELARHAETSGAAGIATLAPYFIKPALRELVDFCQALAAAAPATPFYYYQIPSMTGVSVPVASFFEEAQNRIPTLAGAKFTFEDLLDLQNALRVAAGRYQVFFGRDEILLAGLALGCTGGVGSTYNFASGLFHRVIAAFHRGDLAEARMEQQRGAQFISAIVRHGGLATMKPLMKILGRDCGPTRSPLRRLSDAETASLEADLRKIGFFDWH